MDMEVVASRVNAALQNAAMLGDDRTQELANKFACAIEPALELAAQDLLTGVVEDVNQQLPGVELQVVMGLQGSYLTARESKELLPECGDTDIDAVPKTAIEAPKIPAEQGMEASPANEADQVRLTLRLPGSLKTEIEQLAMRQHVSLNTQIVQLLSSALHGQGAMRIPSAGCASDTAEGDAGKTKTTFNSQLTGWLI